MSIKFRSFKNVLFKIMILLFSFSLIIPLFLIFFLIFQKGISVINWNFIFSTNIPSLGSKEGGIFSNIIGSFLLIIFATIISVPIGILTGVYLAENKKSILSTIIKFCIDILQGVPSIIFGLVVYIWIVSTTKKFSGYSGSIALAFMMLPVIVKSTEETVKLIPHSLKEASIALGVPYYKTILKIIIPTAFSGIMTGIIIGVSRIFGETAPLLFTAYGNNFFNIDMANPIASLPHLIYNYAISPYPQSWDVAWGASFVLLIIVLSLNLISKLVVKKWKT